MQPVSNLTTVQRLANRDHGHTGMRVPTYLPVQTPFGQWQQPNHGSTDPPQWFPVQRDVNTIQRKVSATMEPTPFPGTTDGSLQMHGNETQTDTVHDGAQRLIVNGEQNDEGLLTLQST